MTLKLMALTASSLLASACAPYTATDDPNFVEAVAEESLIEGPVTAFTGARVFDGRRFVSRNICVAGKQIVRCTDRPDQTIDLEGSFITSPFGDAHTHHFDGPFTLGWHRTMGIESGAFYAMTMTAPTSGVLEIRDRLRGPGNIDVATSLGGLTGPESHPAEIYEALALNIRSYEEQVARANEIHAGSRYADNAYYVVESEEDVTRKLALLLSNEPDHVKVYLRHSERYAEGWGKWGPGGGVDPGLLPAIARLTEEAGLRLAVAVSSVDDFRASLSVQADIVTHLPCYQDTESDPSSIYYDVSTADECLLSTADAETAARVGAVGTLITTEWQKNRPAKIVDWERQNVAKLRAAGATLVVATNAYGSMLTEGLVAGVEKGFFKPSDMLRMATMDTPRVIFPDRRVGCLDVGCEASFIAFAGNPLEDFSAIRAIRYRVKDGQSL